MKLFKRIKSYFLNTKLGRDYTGAPPVDRPDLSCINLVVAGQSVYVYGGPYREKPDNIKGVKMAVEINQFADIYIDTVDFSVPPLPKMERGVAEAIEILKRDREIYVGCMGGIGRTGLFMACLWKEIYRRECEKENRMGDMPNADTLIGAVRQTYNRHAVETPQQRDYVEAF